MDVVASLYAGATNATIKTYYADLLFNYSIARATEQIDPGLQTGLGEPKFNLDNSIFTGKLVCCLDWLFHRTDKLISSMGSSSE